jgi:hypothetical protein
MAARITWVVLLSCGFVSIGVARLRAIRTGRPQRPLAVLGIVLAAASIPVGIIAR